MFRSFRGIEGASGCIKWLFETENNMCDVRSPGKRRAQKQSNRCELYIFCLSYYFRRHQVRTSGDTMTHFPKRPGHQKASGSIKWLRHNGFEAENDMCDAQALESGAPPKQSNRSDVYIFRGSYYVRGHHVGTSWASGLNFPKLPGHQGHRRASGGSKTQRLRLKTACATAEALESGAPKYN